ncbi:LysM peptidoglycan-binding domain-containing protein [Cohnella sp. REN36]|uniref:LysM peptidoglycan-binding domain-containing protein n=1 Tax=Cohnella sp. REN36 TaxID=2887347 RepID=UPI001D15A4D2|nr:LysM peptidoglycan-binding domain-containing protein [Cohnella sp. REN36]
MEFYLIDPATKNRFQFPVNPEEVSIRRDKQFETTNILALDEVDFAQGAKIKEISFSSFFPLVHPFDEQTATPHPVEAMNLLTTYMDSKKPVQLLITETGINVLVFISSHSTTLRGGEPGDVYFDITFRTWRELKTRTTLPVGSASPRTDTKQVPKVYNVRSGDTLTAIAKRELGSSAKWSAIYDKNKTLIGKDPNHIAPGQKLVMP